MSRSTKLLFTTRSGQTTISSVLAPLAPRRGEGLRVRGCHWKTPATTGGAPALLPPRIDLSSDTDWLEQSLPALIDWPPATMTVPIEQIRLGQRVIGENPEPFDVAPDFTDPVQTETRRIAATVLKEDGTTIDNGTMHDESNGITQSLNGQDSRLQSFGNLHVEIGSMARAHSAGDIRGSGHLL
ncbi:hypothetical protein [Stieleria mannarensis]|uniref:hypothetical protein n=1 Tax=Stieleria mannarensis TaxID=2755585 RepID=UPI0015FEF36A|nr:hypothetical protein [Rhodopirellula sp. JC639]